VPAKQFFNGRLLIDIVTMYYGHPQAWGEIGFAGPASPRAMCAWVSVDTFRAKPLSMPDIVPQLPRGKDGRAPDVLRPGGWVPMRQFRDDDEVNFAIVGAGAGGGTLAARMAEAGFSVVGFDVGPWYRLLEEFGSDELDNRQDPD
jgi:hypothetical protein